MTDSCPYYYMTGLLVGGFIFERSRKRKREFIINAACMTLIAFGIERNNPKYINMGAIGCISYLLAREDIDKFFDN